MSEKWIYFSSVLQNTLSSAYNSQKRHGGSSLYLPYVHSHWTVQVTI